MTTVLSLKNLTRLAPMLASKLATLIDEEALQSQDAEERYLRRFPEKILPLRYAGPGVSYLSRQRMPL